MAGPTALASSSPRRWAPSNQGMWMAVVPEGTQVEQAGICQAELSSPPQRAGGHGQAVTAQIRKAATRTRSKNDSILHRRHFVILATKT